MYANFQSFAPISTFLISPKWFRAPNLFPSHTDNAYEDSHDNIVFDPPLTDKNAFSFWPDADGNALDPQETAANLVRFTFHPRSDNLDLPPPQMLL
ncbi:hypothetical protein K469DRAFT_235644 [Zopfia rhizophila CBS 207.26]|uniref:Uncharacterized protein n=1 Tax=Zopfia rhizophila CBS 207.26 TaxID=1314779 RepID=A0A6A6EPA1_9PEZI|nr:hypothetical protein K469DRAFT_235644 [Zopfia rhizophila CBS 207.26]